MKIFSILSGWNKTVYTREQGCPIIVLLPMEEQWLGSKLASCFLRDTERTWSHKGRRNPGQNGSSTEVCSWLNSPLKSGKTLSAATHVTFGKSPFLPQQRSTGEVFALRGERWADVPPTGSLPYLRQSQCLSWEVRGSSKTQLNPQHRNRGSCVFLRGLDPPPAAAVPRGQYGKGSPVLVTRRKRFSLLRARPLKQQKKSVGSRSDWIYRNMYLQTNTLR